MPVPFTRQTPPWEDGHTVLAEDAERWEQLGADTAEWTSKADYAVQDRSAMARRGMPSPCWTRTGLWLGVSGNWNEPNRLSLCVITCSELGRVLDRVRYGIITAGSADALVRFGFYNVSPDSWIPIGDPLSDNTGPGDLSGQHEITLPETRGFPEGLPLAFAFVSQGVTPGILEAQTNGSGAYGWYGTDGNAVATAAYTGNSMPPGVFSMPNVTGPLPTLSGLSYYSRAPLVGVRFA